ncbi:unnamed protein product [Ostreobium quekettii]|uniref:Protein kinase domain-containing protein n=1 Tax=Ostreobium quekettii TaxID=121088 RepID=A0A8S1J6N7_9CHLO|nr:unnamed protein product [Ostreobium quekettii]
MWPLAVSWRLLLICAFICTVDSVAEQTNAQRLRLKHEDGCLTPIAVHNCTAFWAALQSLPSNDQGRIIVISGSVNCSSFSGGDIELRGKTIVRGCGPQCPTPVLDLGSQTGKILLSEGASLAFHGVVVLQDWVQLSAARGVIMPAIALQGGNNVRYGVSVLAANHCAAARLRSSRRQKSANPKSAGRKMRKELRALGADVETDFTINNATINVGADGTGGAQTGEVLVELVRTTGDALLNKLGVIEFCETVVLCQLGNSVEVLAKRLQDLQAHDCGSFESCGQVGSLSADEGPVPAETETEDGSGSNNQLVVIAVSTTVTIIVLLLAATMFSSYVVNKRRRKEKVDTDKPKPSPQAPTRQEEPKHEPSEQAMARQAEKVKLQQDNAHDAYLAAREESSSGGASDWSKLDIRDVEFEALIGKGGFGKVYKVRYHGEVLALKMINHEDVSGDAVSQPLEVYFSQSIKHRHVVRTYLHNTHKRSCSEAPCMTPISARSEADWLSYIGSVNEMELGDFRTWLVMEFCDMGTLQQAIEDRDSTFFGFGGGCAVKKARLVLSCARDVTSAMAYLHSLDIIHGDLKAQNILLQTCRSNERGFICKVADFGLSRSSRCRSYIQTNTFGTVSHMPPELLSDGILTPATDVYSFGMMLFEMISGEAPYSSMEYTEIVMGVVAGVRPTIPRNCPPAVALLIKDCWHRDYRLRPTFREIADRLDNIIDHMTCPVDDKEDPLLLKGDVGARPQEEPPVPSFLIGRQTLSARCTSLVDTAFSMPHGQDPAAAYTPRDGAYTPRDGAYTPRDEVYTPRDDVYTPRDEVYTPRDEVCTPRDAYASAEETDEYDSGADGYLSSRTFQ